MEVTYTVYKAWEYVERHSMAHQIENIHLKEHAEVQ